MTGVERYRPPMITVLSEVPLATYTAREQVSSPENAYGVLAPLFAGLDREAAIILSIDTGTRLLAVDTVSIGCVAHTFMEPREVYRTALMRGATSIIVAHNHPSGRPEPSADDRAITRRLVRAGEALKVSLLDHLVVGDAGQWRSMAQMGLL